MKWQAQRAGGRPALGGGGCIVPRLSTRTRFRERLGGGCISSAQGPVHSPASGFGPQQGRFLVTRYALSHGSLTDCPNTVSWERTGYYPQAKKKKAGVRGKGHKNWLVLNTATVTEVEAHVTDDFTRSLCCLEGKGVQSQFIATISKFAPGLLVPRLLGRCTQMKGVL